MAGEDLNEEKIFICSGPPTKGSLSGHREKHIPGRDRGKEERSALSSSVQ